MSIACIYHHPLFTLHFYVLNCAFLSYIFWIFCNQSLFLRLLCHFFHFFSDFRKLKFNICLFFLHFYFDFEFVFFHVSNFFTVFCITFILCVLYSVASTLRFFFGGGECFNLLLFVVCFSILTLRMLRFFSVLELRPLCQR